MSAFSFFKSYAKVKTSDGFQAISEGIIKADLSGATAAQLDMYDQKLAELSSKTSSAFADYQREQAEADNARQAHNTKVAAAQNINGKIQQTTDEAQKASLSASLNSLLDEIDADKINVQREVKEAEDAKAIYDSYKSSLDAIALKLSTARQALKGASARIEHAKQDEARSQDLLDAKREQAGLTSSTSGLDSVLKTMDSIASKSESKANANRQYADALTPKVAPVDANIQAALDEVSGKKPDPSKNDISARMGSLETL